MGLGRWLRGPRCSLHPCDGLSSSTRTHTWQRKAAHTPVLKCACFYPQSVNNYLTKATKTATRHLGESTSEWLGFMSVCNKVNTQAKSDVMPQRLLAGSAPSPSRLWAGSAAFPQASSFCPRSHFHPVYAFVSPPHSGKDSRREETRDKNQVEEGGREGSSVGRDDCWQVMV